MYFLLRCGTMSKAICYFLFYYYCYFLFYYYYYFLFYYYSLLISGGGGKRCLGGRTLLAYACPENYSIKVGGSGPPNLFPSAKKVHFSVYVSSKQGGDRKTLGIISSELGGAVELFVSFRVRSCSLGNPLGPHLRTLWFEGVFVFG